MIYFLSSTIIELGLDVSWWFLKKGTYLLYNGIVYLYDYSKSDENTNDVNNIENISDSIVIIENEEILDELKEIKKILNKSRHLDLEVEN